MDEEAEQQRITFLLQEIDGHICAAHRSATEMCQKLRRHNQLLKRIRVATGKWKPLFETMGMNGADHDQNGENEHDEDNRDAEEEAEDQRQNQLMRDMKNRMLRELEEREEDEEVSAEIQTPQFKTTEPLELRETHQQQRSRTKALNLIMSSPAAAKSVASPESSQQTIEPQTPPEMNTTRATESPNQVANEINGECQLHDINETTVHKNSTSPDITSTPVMSPPKTQLIELEDSTAHSDQNEQPRNHRELATSPAKDQRQEEQDRQQLDKENVPVETSAVNKNLMKSGAFGVAPIPRAPTPPRRRAAQQTPQERNLGRSAHRTPNASVSATAAAAFDMSPLSPDLPQFTTLAALEKLPSPQLQHREERQQTTPGSTARKRKRVENETSSPSTPYQSQSPASILTPPDLLTTPSQLGLRRKYNLMQIASPDAAGLRGQTSVAAYTATPTQVSGDSTRTPLSKSSPEEITTPSFEMTSPLLCTQVMTLTAGTPISNRIVGATHQIGSAEQEATLHALNERNQASHPPPKFELSVFPNHLQRGIGAIQLTTVYGKFQNHKDTMSLDQLLKLLPDYGSDRLAALVDALVSRRFLRPFVMEGTMYWQLTK